MPSLRFGQEYSFDTKVAVQISHNLPKSEDLVTPTILFVRDPRDAIYSQFRREVASSDFTGTYSDFLKKLDPVYCLDPMATWRMWHFVSSHYKESLTVQFEEKFLSGEKVLTEVLEFLGVVRSRAEIKAAVNDSSLEKVRKSAGSASKAQLKYTHARKGLPEEWKTRSDSIVGDRLVEINLGMLPLSKFNKHQSFSFQFESGLLRFHPSFHMSQKVVKKNLESNVKGLQQNDKEALQTLVSALITKGVSNSMTVINAYICSIRAGFLNGEMSLFFRGIYGLGTEIAGFLSRRWPPNLGVRRGSLQSKK